MAKWATLLNLSGTYTSLPFLIPLTSDGVVSYMDWQANIPSGTQLVVQTRFQIGGRDWSPWRTCTAKAEIPGLNELSPFHQVSLMYRVTMWSNSYEVSPSLNQIQFNMKPIIVFDNQGDQHCHPELWITKVNQGDLTITNLSTAQPPFTFTQLLDEEQLYINNEQQHIETSLPVVYRYKDFNDHYLQLPPGKNRLHVDGQANLSLRYQYTYL
jgi:hypothetical protein